MTLDDRASSGLANLQNQMRQMGTGAPAAGMESLRRQGAEVTMSMQGMGSAMQQASVMAGVVGGAVGALALKAVDLGISFIGQATNFKGFSDEMVKLNQASARSAESMGQFKANVDVMRASGIEASEAASMLNKFTVAYADLQKGARSQLRRDLLAGLREEDRANMESLLTSIRGMSQTQAMNAIREYGQAIRAFHAERGQEERGTIAMIDFYAKMGLAGLERVRDEFGTTTAEMQRLFEERGRDAERYATTAFRSELAWSRVTDSLKASGTQIVNIAREVTGTTGLLESTATFLEKFETTLRAGFTRTEQLMQTARRQEGIARQQAFAQREAETKQRAEQTRLLTAELGRPLTEEEAAAIEEGREPEREAPRTEEERARRREEWERIERERRQAMPWYQRGLFEARALPEELRTPEEVTAAEPQLTPSERSAERRRQAARRRGGRGFGGAAAVAAEAGLEQPVPPAPETTALSENTTATEASTEATERLADAVEQLAPQVAPVPEAPALEAPQRGWFGRAAERVRGWFGGGGQAEAAPARFGGGEGLATQGIQIDAEAWDQFLENAPRSANIEDRRHEDSVELVSGLDALTSAVETRFGGLAPGLGADGGATQPVLFQPQQEALTPESFQEWFSARGQEPGIAAPPELEAGRAEQTITDAQFARLLNFFNPYGGIAKAIGGGATAITMAGRAAAESTPGIEGALTYGDVGRSLMSAFQGLRGGGGEEAGAATIDRAAQALDRAAVQNINVNGTGKLSVDVNAPPGTRVAAEGEGLFKTTEVTRMTQMMPAEAGPLPQTGVNAGMGVMGGMSG